MTKLSEEKLQDEATWQREWDALTYAQKNVQLFLKQKKLLEEFLSHPAITREEYENGLSELTKKMGIADSKR